MRSAPGAMIHVGESLIVDNRHGISKLEAGEFYDQAIFADGDNGRLGWWWNVGLKEPERGVLGAPKRMTGWNPFSTKERVGAALPVQISKVSALTLSFRVDRLAYSGKANLSADVWIQADPEKTGELFISGEMMIWFGSFGYAPSGVTEIGSFRYFLWSGKILRGNWHPYPTWIFLLEKHDTAPVLSAIFPVSACLSQLVRIGELTPELYVSSVQLMTEVVSGHGICLLDHFGVQVKRSGE